MASQPVESFPSPQFPRPTMGAPNGFTLSVLGHPSSFVESINDSKTPIRNMKNVKKIIVTTGLSATIALAALTGCSNLPGNEPKDGRSAGRVKDDKNITKRVKDGLQAEPVYKFESVDVRTFGGVVQLSGFVDAADQKRRAEEIARRVPGPSQVVNNLILKPTSIPKPTGQAKGERLGPPANTNTSQPTDRQ